MKNALLNEYLSKYYPKLLNTCRMRVRFYDMHGDPKDVLQDAMLCLCMRPSEYIDELLEHENHGEPHLFNYIMLQCVRIIKSAIRGKRFVHELIYEGHMSTPCLIPWSDLKDSEYAKFREVTCNLRPDDFAIPLCSGIYVTPKSGWVSGFIHKYNKGPHKYVYWLYCAYVGSRCKGEKPRRIKISHSKHEAYLGLMKYNRLLK